MKAFVIDIDGVMTDGKLYYTSEGKAMKVFGADDHDALDMLKNLIEIRFITADHRGFPISHCRIVEDMGFTLELVPAKSRIDWLQERWDLSEVIYMGDGILDGAIFEKVGYSICPADGFYKTRDKANYITQHSGGHRAVAEACLHIKEKFEL